MSSPSIGSSIWSLQPTHTKGYLAIPTSVLLTTLLYSYLTYDKRRKDLPPGPKGYPIIGNLPSLLNPDKIPSITQRWAKQHGPVVYTKMAGLKILLSPIIADSVRSRFQPKPLHLHALRLEMARPAQDTPFRPEHEHVRDLSYEPIQDYGSKQDFFDFLKAAERKDQEAFYDINRRVPDWDDPYIKKIYEVLEHFTLMSEPGAWLVDAFPSLAKLPSWMVQGWWKPGREWFEYDRQVYLQFYRDLVDKIRDSTAPDCFIRDLYESKPESIGIDEEQAAYAAGTLVEAGSESTPTVINAWILACQLYPKAMAAAQEELDRVVGPGRMPSFDGEQNLPYIRSMVKETLRWWPITQAGNEPFFFRRRLVLRLLHSKGRRRHEDGTRFPHGAHQVPGAA
ncbi:hypothetical protein MKZ38_008667 [Zalerion maritima]|uniref:Cytochrome P450 n=1 Tax=Zalerion maritima TaxID=339359 RepID=A0AAD5RGV9_9PEZI|nr:hypothetical protein MKZ38_008667 [Zalerion maritima]